MKNEVDNSLGSESGEDKASEMSVFLTEMDCKVFLDPWSLSLTDKAFPLDVIVKRLKRRQLLFSHESQRKEAWSRVVKSRLIESIMLGIPISTFCFSSDRDNVLTVIDGQQRLAAIRDFFIGFTSDTDSAYNKDGHQNDCRSVEALRLTGLEYFHQLEGLIFSELPVEFVNRLMEAKLSTFVIEPNTPEEVKRNIIKRINTKNRFS